MPAAGAPGADYTFGVHWARTTDGFAANLDGTDAAREFSFPRLELHSGPAGWEGRCLLPNGTALDLPVGHASTNAAKAALVAHAREALGPAHAAALQALAPSPV
jgi:hypothetical protein